MVLQKINGRQIWVEGPYGLQKLDLKKGKRGRPPSDTAPPSEGTVRGSGREEPPRVRLIRMIGSTCGACGTGDERVLGITRRPGAPGRDGTGTALYLWYLLRPREARRDLRVLCANCRALDRSAAVPRQ